MKLLINERIQHGIRQVAANMADSSLPYNGLYVVCHDTDSSLARYEQDA
jgi:hypothetical protein